MAISLSSAIHKIQLSLFETPSTPLHLLLSAAALLSRPDYTDVVVERSIADLCGNPTCPNPLPSAADRRKRSRYRVSLREHRVFDLEETCKFCSEECLISSAAFSETLSETRRADLDIGRRRIAEVMGLFFGSGGAPEERGRGAGFGGKLEIREKGVGGGEVAAEEWIGPSNAIEGYIPLADRGPNYLPNLESVERIGSAGSNETDLTSSIVTGDKMDGDISMIAKRLNNVTITQMKTTSNNTSSCSSRPECQPMATNKARDESDFSGMDFTSSIIYGDDTASAFPNTCSLTTEDVSELITNQLENVCIAEKKAAKGKTLSKPTRPKAKKKASNKRINKMDFEGSTIIGNKDSAVASITSALSQDCSERLVEESKYGINFQNKAESKTSSEGTKFTQSEDQIYAKKAAGSQVTTLKSSLRTSGSKVAENRSVKWADERGSKVLEDKTEAPPVLLDEDDTDSSLRVASAEACVSALIQAAEAVASGVVEAGNAVSEAGIVILPQMQCENEGGSEADEDAFEFDRGVLKWPKKTVLLDTDMFDVEDSWHDTPPEGFSLTLSTFATMWMALFGWITCSSLAYIYGHDDSTQNYFLSVNGREYPRKVHLFDGKSDEIKLALGGFITRALPTLVMDLRLSIPVSTLEKFVGRLLDTMSFVDPLPSFRIKQWQVIVLLFIEALSVHRLPSLTPHITNGNMLVHKVLTAAQVSTDEYETMRDLIIPLCRLPQFSIP
ncbi:putative RNA polymerase II subunit B1 CTD phosphatase RPAP2-like protein [Iris pallida]|uniref:RNA polymerase II subunit B1 CTD phosphatase RPAP2 homolog n=1 Tax=Iris pallida TaxID=29817 RepID=A0AAX6F181_IRIPA|nr:putative RNA polymerase II subunit B1 CTD phosphatase RPAP2-like protein [Iris pallida]